MNKARNQINVLHIFKEDGVWMFNDGDIDIYKEPFISSMNPIIESMVKGDKFIAFISKDPMPYTLILDRIDKRQKWLNNNIDMIGHYKLRGTKLIGWLCPCLLNYFTDYPKEIYVKIEE